MSRTSIILIIILAVQFGIFAIVSSNPSRVQEPEPVVKIDTSEVDYVHIKNEDGDVTLKRIGGNWRVSEPFSYPANPSYANTLMEKIAEMDYESFITRNKDKYLDYEVDDSSGAFVEVGKEGGDIEKFYCGKPSKTYTHTYIRKLDSGEVWLVSGTPRSSFTRKPKDWRDKKILDLDKTLIERVLLHFPDETVELSRSISSPANDTTLVQADTSWTIIPKHGKPFTPDEKVLNRVMNTCKRMNSMDFKIPGVDKTPDFSKPELRAEIFLEGNRRELLEFMPDPDDDKRWVVRKNDNDDIYFVVYESTAKNLQKRPDDFKEKKEEKS